MPSAARKTIDHGLHRQTIAESILADIFRGKLRAGQHLVTQELAERFAVSHTPIREALILLGGIGIIDLLPNRGAVVRQVDVQEVREICQVRRLLEVEATRSACGKLDRDQLEILLSVFRELIEPKKPGPEYVRKARDSDSQLHDLIWSTCGNKFLAKELGRLKLLFRSFRDVAYAWDESRLDFKRLGLEAKEHLKVVEALLRNDPREAGRAMSRHIVSAAKYWCRVLPPTE